jgi:hypothetical protein
VTTVAGPAAAPRRFAGGAALGCAVETELGFLVGRGRAVLGFDLVVGRAVFLVRS